MADLQLQQHDPGSQPGQPSPPTPRNASRGRWCSSTLDGSETGRMGSSVVGRLTNVVCTRGQLVLPSSLRPDVPREVRDYISSCERCTVVPCFRKKEGDMMLGMVIQ